MKRSCVQAMAKLDQPRSTPLVEALAVESAQLAAGHQQVCPCPAALRAGCTECMSLRRAGLSVHCLALQGQQVYACSINARSAVCAGYSLEIGCYAGVSHDPAASQAARVLVAPLPGQRGGALGHVLGRLSQEPSLVRPRCVCL